MTHRAEFFQSFLDGTEEMSYECCASLVRDAVENGQFWIAELSEPNAEGKRIVGAATWYGPGQQFRRGYEINIQVFYLSYFVSLVFVREKDYRSPWDELMEKVSEKNRQWWDAVRLALDSSKEAHFITQVVE